MPTFITFEILFPILLLTGLGWFVLKQIIIPLWAGTGLFPMLRKDSLSIVDQIKEANEQDDIERLIEQLQDLKKEKTDADDSSH